MALNTKQVGSYTVTQMGALESARLRLFQRQNAELEQKQGNLDPARVEAWNEWAVVAACVTPHITRDDYLAIPVMETRLLIDAVEELNAGLLEGDQPKKKKTSQPKPTSG